MARPRKQKEILISEGDARQGDIVLRRQWQRGVFLIGLAAAIILAIIIGFLV